MNAEAITRLTASVMSHRTQMTAAPAVCASAPICRVIGRRSCLWTARREQKRSTFHSHRRRLFIGGGGDCQQTPLQTLLHRFAPPRTNAGCQRRAARKSSQRSKETFSRQSPLFCKKKRESTVDCARRSLCSWSPANALVGSDRTRSRCCWLGYVCWFYRHYCGILGGASCLRQVQSREREREHQIRPAEVRDNQFKHTRTGLMTETDPWTTISGDPLFPCSLMFL